MDIRNKADQLVATLGGTLGIDDLALDEAGYALLVFDGTIVVNMELDPVGERMLFYCFLTQLPEEPPASLLKEALAANLLWHGTQGATLALEEYGNGLTLCHAEALAPLDDNRLEDVLDVFVQTASDWQKKADALLAEAEELPSPSPNGDGPTQGAIRA